MDRKHCGKRRNCSLRAISPFSTVFSKDLNCRHVKNQGLFGKGLKVKLFPKLDEKRGINGCRGSGKQYKHVLWKYTDNITQSSWLCDASIYKHEWCLALLTLHHTILTFNFLPNNKILDKTTWKSFADNKIHVAKTGFYPGRALAPFAQKNSRWRKKIQLDGPEGAPNFSNQKTTKSDFRDVVLVF